LQEAIADSLDGVEEFSTEPFSANIGKRFSGNWFLLVASSSFWRFAL
jgi:hypothetical protein